MIKKIKTSLFITLLISTLQSTEQYTLYHAATNADDDDSKIPSNEDSHLYENDFSDDDHLYQERPIPKEEQFLYNQFMNFLDLKKQNYIALCKNAIQMSSSKENFEEKILNIQEYFLQQFFNQICHTNEEQSNPDSQIIFYKDIFNLLTRKNQITFEEILKQNQESYIKEILIDPIFQKTVIQSKDTNYISKYNAFVSRITPLKPHKKKAVPLYKNILFNTYIENDTKIINLIYQRLRNAMQYMEGATHFPEKLTSELNYIYSVMAHLEKQQNWLKKYAHTDTHKKSISNLQRYYTNTIVPLYRQIVSRIESVSPSKKQRLETPTA